MYAVTFDLDQQRLDKHYPGAHVDVLASPSE